MKLYPTTKLKQILSNKWDNFCPTTKWNKLYPTKWNNARKLDVYTY